MLERSLERKSLCLDEGATSEAALVATVRGYGVRRENVSAARRREFDIRLASLVFTMQFLKVLLVAKLCMCDCALATLQVRMNTGSDRFAFKSIQVGSHRPDPLVFRCLLSPKCYGHTKVCSL